MSKLPDWLIICTSDALLGEIYPNIRLIALKYDKNNQYLLIRYYLDRDPTEYDYKSIFSVGEKAQIIAGEQLKKVDLECIYETNFRGKLDQLDGLVYARKED